MSPYTVNFKGCLRCQWRRFIFGKIKHLLLPNNSPSRNYCYHTKFEVLTEVTMKSLILWAAAPCRLVKACRFGGKSTPYSGSRQETNRSSRHAKVAAIVMALCSGQNRKVHANLNPFVYVGRQTLVSRSRDPNFSFMKTVFLIWGI
jgi:hypothetical protein